jgi:hypothetical protein
MGAVSLSMLAEVAFTHLRIANLQKQIFLSALSSTRYSPALCPAKTVFDDPHPKPRTH